MTFTHLQIRTGYSFYQSTVQIEPLVERAKEMKFDALALTDEAVLYGAISFYQACLQHGIKPIFGLKLSLYHEGDTVKCILLAKSNKGYKNLINISTNIQAYETYEVEELFEETEELFCIVSARTNIVSERLTTEQFEALKQWFSFFERKFLSENVFLGIERIDATDDLVLKKAKTFSEQMDVTPVALHDVRYINKGEAASYNCLQAMKAGVKWTSASNLHEEQSLHLRSAGEMKMAFSHWEEPLIQTEVIANQCNVTFSFNHIHLPSFPIKENESSASYLQKLATEAIAQKFTDESDKKRAQERLAYELSVIDELGFNDYFLIVSDFVQFAKRKGIAVGPGRGSAAGSLVSYLLGITDVDPLKYNLLFERFLNPERVSMPDIDIDFSDIRRDEVIEYVRNKYGSEYVAQIITFGTFGARSILREVMKAMDINESDQTYILRHIPLQSSRTIVESIKAEKELVQYIKQSKQLTTLFKIAIQLEGLPRHMSTHAAGIVIGRRPLIEDVPLTKGTHDTLVTQYAMNELEAIGMLKMDILGLKNLTLIERIVTSIQRTEDGTFSLSMINEKDKETFNLLQKGQTNGIFQFESSGMRQMLMKVKPTSLDDLIALNALYRPGPMEHIPTYTRRKHGIEKTTYLHPDLEPILKETYGVLIYQEQIMQIVNKFASFSLGEADLLRRAISAKSRTDIESQKERFIEGCLNNGYSSPVAEELFRWIVTFANYGFNKSHSVAYSKIAYQLAYLKAKYPSHFFAQLLSISIGDDGSKRISYIRDAKEFGIDILAPSINKSYAYYTVEGSAIRMGLLAIKGIGYETVKTIIEARKEKPFTNLFDFALRVKIKRNALETLILAGAFDDTYPNRASLLASITPALERAELFGGYGDGALFKDSLDMKPSYVEIEDFSIMQKLSDEKELLLTYISNHPLKEKRAMLTVENFPSIARIKKMNVHTNVKLIAYIERFKKIRTKRGDSMAFVTLSDETDELETVIFPNVFRHVGPILEESQLYSIVGKVSIRNDETQLIINQIAPISFEQIEQKHGGTVYIRFTKNDDESILPFLAQLARSYPGKARVILHENTLKKTYKLSDKYSLNYNVSVGQKLVEKFGYKNVVFKG